MSVEVAIIGGLGILTFTFADVTFSLWQRSQHEGGGLGGVDWERLLGLMSFLLTVVFLNMTMYAILLIAQNNSITYLNDTVLRVGLAAVMWSTLGGLSLYLFVLGIGGLYFFLQKVREFRTGRNRRKGEASG